MIAFIILLLILCSYWYYNSKCNKISKDEELKQREEKAKMSGDHKAWIKGKKIEAFQAARKCYLQAHPEVGTLIRNGKELFYVNLQPYHLGKTKEFTPQSVIKIG
jgi:hypothetical protein